MTTTTDLLCIHGYTAGAGNWAPVVDGLSARHTVHVARLAGHRDGPPLPAGVAPTAGALADQLERDLDALAIDRAHLVGNSLGGWLALELAARGRALSVTALAPGLGWSNGGADVRVLDAKLRVARALITKGAPVLGPLFGSATGRRWGLKLAVAHGDRMTPEAARSMITDMASCTIAAPLRRWLIETEHELGPIDCPVLIAWSEHDALLPRTPYGARFAGLVPNAEQITLPGVGHVPTYDDPALVVRTILGVTRGVDGD